MTVEITGSTLRVWDAGCVPGTPGPGPLPPARSLYGRGLFIVGLLAGTWGIAPSPAILGRTAWFQAALTTGAAGPAS